MSKFWAWCKTFFSKAQPVINKVEPIVVIAAETADPSLAPKIDAASQAFNAVKGAINQKA